MKKFLQNFALILICCVFVASSFFMLKTVMGLNGGAPVPAVAESPAPVLDNSAVPVDSGSVANEDVSVQSRSSADIEAPKDDSAPVNGSADDVSNWSKQQIADFYVKAVNNTKAQKGNFSADHMRVLDATVTKCTGGSIPAKIANGIVQGQLEKTNEVLTFANGSAKRQDGSTVTLAIFPPMNDKCTLPVEGIASASAKKEGDNTVLTITLIAEEGTYSTPPKYNSLAVGYFDFNSLNLSSNVKIKDGTVNYPKSEITVTINKDNIVTYEMAKVPIKINMQGSIMGINGDLVIEGSADESWDFKY